MQNNNVKSKNKVAKGSVLVFSMIILFLILMSALAIGAATVIERKNSLSSNKSTQGFQAADTGIEIAAKKIKEAVSTTVLNNASLFPTCLDGSIVDTSLGADKQVIISFFTDIDATPAALANCVTNTAGDIKSLRAAGTYFGITRAVKAPAANHQATIMATPDLVSYWKMDESTWPATAGAVKDSDTTTPVNNGTAYGGVTTTNIVGDYNFGVYGGSFDGTNDYISVADNDVLSPNQFTIEAWIKWDGIRYTVAQLKDKAAIVAKGRDASGEYSILMSRLTGATDNTFYFYINNTLRASWNAGTLDTNWHYLAVTYDGSLAKIYFDGIQKNSSSYTATITNTVNAFRIGAQSTGTAYYWGGKIDEVAFYSRALIQPEIQSRR
jgi:hypothetical protein